jgi:two-component system response regulator HydG
MSPATEATAASTGRILLVDDDKDQCEVLEGTLRALGHDATHTTSPLEALNRVSREPFDAIVSDLRMSGMDGLELCTRILATRPHVPVIVVTGAGSMEVAVDAMRAGAYDFLTKPLDSTLAAVSVGRAIKHHRLQVEVTQLREQSLERTAAQELLGPSRAMNQLRDLVARLGPNDVNVLIQGETGTGKKLVARALHSAGPRRSGPFVAINCGAVPASLLESELFGDTRGAFTDAHTARDGLLVQASGGTLLLDEIDDMPFEMQTKLLRVLQEKTVRPVGSAVERAFDVRILVATHRELEAEIVAKRFRADLYYRVNVVRIRVPPLRAREGDVLVLATHFLKREAANRARGEMKLSPRVASLLQSHSWPGNVRELKNCVARAVALARLDHVSAEDLPERMVARHPTSFALPAKDSVILTLDEFDRRYTERAMSLLAGDTSRVAEVLGFDRRTLCRRLEKYGLEGRGAHP